MSPDPEADVVATKRVVFALMRTYSMSFAEALEVALADVPLMLEHLANSRPSREPSGGVTLEDELAGIWAAGRNGGVPRELTEVDSEWPQGP